MEVTLTCDESAFEGSGAFLLGAVLERFFAKYVSLNSFTETVLRTVQRGEIMRWQTRAGRRKIL
jgi:type VI secretion system protein ImpG